MSMRLILFCVSLTFLAPTKLFALPPACRNDISELDLKGKLVSLTQYEGHASNILVRLKNAKREQGLCFRTGLNLFKEVVAASHFGAESAHYLLDVLVPMIDLIAMGEEPAHLIKIFQDLCNSDRSLDRKITAMNLLVMSKKVKISAEVAYAHLVDLDLFELAKSPRANPSYVDIYRWILSFDQEAEGTAELIDQYKDFRIHFVDSPQVALETLDLINAAYVRNPRSTRAELTLEFQKIAKKYPSYRNDWNKIKLEFAQQFINSAL